MMEDMLTLLEERGVRECVHDLSEGHTKDLIDRFCTEYPFGLSSLEAERCERLFDFFVEEARGSLKAEEVEKLLSAQAPATAEVVRTLCSEDTSLYWLADSNARDLTFRARDLQRLMPILCSFPQHSYVVPEDLSFCLLYKMTSAWFKSLEGASSARNAEASFALPSIYSACRSLIEARLGAPDERSSLPSI